jgi:hypothetical protein
MIDGQWDLVGPDFSSSDVHHQEQAPYKLIVKTPMVLVFQF